MSAVPDPACPVPPVVPEPPPERLLQVQVREDVNYGDHGDFMAKPLVYIPGETVEELVRRALPGLSSNFQRVGEHDRVEVQPMPGPDGTLNHWQDPPERQRPADPWASL